MGFSAVLFDLDGTLVDSVSLILESFRHALKQMGISAQEKEILATIGLPLKEVCLRFAGDRQEEMFKCYVEFQDAIHDDYVKEYAGTTALFGLLKEKGYKIGIVTSKRRAIAIRGLSVVGLEGFIEVIVAFEDTMSHKPDPEPVRKALGVLGASPTKTLFVGDSPFDIRCGKNAGVYTAGVTWGVSTEEQLTEEHPDVIINEWGELNKYLENFDPDDALAPAGGPDKNKV